MGPLIKKWLDHDLWELNLLCRPNINFSYLRWLISCIQLGCPGDPAPLHHVLAQQTLLTWIPQTWTGGPWFSTRNTWMHMYRLCQCMSWLFILTSDKSAKIHISLALNIKWEMKTEGIIRNDKLSHILTK